MSEVTQHLSAIEQGDPSAAEQLLPLVYDELRKLAAQKLAHEQSGQSLDATALVHEATCVWPAPTGTRTGTAASISSAPPPPCGTSSWTGPAPGTARSAAAPGGRSIWSRRRQWPPT